MSALEDPRLEQAQKQLAAVVRPYLNRPMNARMVQDMQHDIAQFGVSQRLRGVRFPKLTVAAVYPAQFFSVWPAELEHEELQAKLGHMIKEMVAAGCAFETEDVAAAVRRAYPDYNPSRSNLKLH